MLTESCKQTHMFKASWEFWQVSFSIDFTRIFAIILKSVSFVGCRGAFLPVWNNIQCVWILKGSFVVHQLYKSVEVRRFRTSSSGKTGKCFDHLKGQFLTTFTVPGEKVKRTAIPPPDNKLFIKGFLSEESWKVESFFRFLLCFFCKCLFWARATPSCSLVWPKTLTNQYLGAFTSVKTTYKYRQEQYLSLWHAGRHLHRAPATTYASHLLWDLAVWILRKCRFVVLGCETLISQL